MIAYKVREESKETDFGFHFSIEKYRVIFRLTFCTFIYK